MKAILIGKPQAYEEFYFNCAKRFVDKYFEQGEDYILSFCNPDLISEDRLRKTKLAINFHSASPEYPGVGASIWALHNKAKEFGVTCHKMDTQPDTGEIIAVKRFPILEGETVESLSERSLGYSLVMFYEVMTLILYGTIPKSNEKWARKPYKRWEMVTLRKGKI